MIAEPDDQRWPITAEQRGQAVQIVMDIITTSGDVREQLAAVRCLLAMEAQNQKDDLSNDGQLRETIHRFARERGITLN